MTEAPAQKAIVENLLDILLAQTTDDPVDRPGCDFGDSTGLTSARLGIGLGDER